MVVWGLLGSYAAHFGVEGGGKRRRQRENLSLPPMCGDVCITIFYVWFVVFFVAIVVLGFDRRTYPLPQE